MKGSGPDFLIQEPDKIVFGSIEVRRVVVDPMEKDGPFHRSDNHGRHVLRPGARLNLTQFDALANDSPDAMTPSIYDFSGAIFQEGKGMRRLHGGMKDRRAASHRRILDESTKRSNKSLQLVGCGHLGVYGLFEDSVRCFCRIVEGGSCQPFTVTERVLGKRAQAQLPSYEVERRCRIAKLIEQTGCFRDQVVRRLVRFFHGASHPGTKP